MEKEEEDKQGENEDDRGFYDEPLPETDSFDYAELTPLVDKIVEDAKKEKDIKATGQQQCEEQKMEMDIIDEEMMCNVAQQVEEATKQEEKEAERKTPDVNTIERHVKKYKRNTMAKKKRGIHL